jgi:hypothetical protein
MDMADSGLRHLSPPMRDLLLLHIDGSASVPVEFNAKNYGQLKSTWAAITHGLIIPDTALLHPLYRSSSFSTLHMKRTFITDKGRAFLAAALADWADALERAHYEAEPAWPSLRWHPGEKPSGAQSKP